MRLFLDALASIGELELLFYVPEHIASAPGAAARYATDFARYWHLSVSVNLCQRVPPVSPHALFSADLVRSPFGRGTRGPEQLAALSRLLAKNFSAIVIHRLNAAYPLLGLPKSPVPVLFDFDDVEHVAFIRSVRQPPIWRTKFLWYLQLPAIIRLERSIAKRANATFVCSEHDARYLRSVWRMPRVVPIRNAVDIPSQIEEPRRTHTVLFVGRLSYGPNAVAADYLVDKIWPRIRSAIPNARLLIVGGRPESTRAFHRHVPGVTFLGYVPDLAPIYSEANVVCCPIWSGSGTRVKIIEAAAFGKAIVSTTLGAEGLAFDNDKEILLRDDSGAIAEACIALLTNHQAACQLGSEARNKAKRLYDREVVIDQIRAVVSTTIAKRATAR
jgi:glycosyltransferase involved in cell wall biosynthesis